MLADKKAEIERENKKDPELCMTIIIFTVGYLDLWVPDM